MELSISDIVSIVGLLLGGGSLGGFFTWRYAQRKEKAEAVQSEATAAKEVQDVYQQMIVDVKADRDEQKAYINELKDDRRHLRAERDELRDRMDKTDETVRELQAQVARNGRMVESLRPFMCGRLDCGRRTAVAISQDWGSPTPGLPSVGRGEGTRGEARGTVGNPERSEGGGRDDIATYGTGARGTVGMVAPISARQTEQIDEEGGEG